MTYRQVSRVFALGVAALLLTALGALAKGSKTINLPYAGTLAGTRVEAGHYQIAWVEHSPEATVTLTREDGKGVVATVQGKIEERSSKYERNMVIYDSKPDGTQVISEVRLGGSNKAIVFGE
ncbi:MAG: hypothetical protein LAN62_19070 [Acidobacteriia bacterium]|nr:hypothetical protein [Terriglobia bacterium]